MKLDDLKDRKGRLFIRRAGWRSDYLGISLNLEFDGLNAIPLEVDGSANVPLSLAAMIADDWEILKEEILLSGEKRSRARGKLGQQLMLAEWNSKKASDHVAELRVYTVDGVVIKEDTWYEMRDGCPVEVGEDS